MEKTYLETHRELYLCFHVITELGWALDLILPTLSLVNPFTTNQQISREKYCLDIGRSEPWDVDNDVVAL